MIMPSYGRFHPINALLVVVLCLAFSSFLFPGAFLSFWPTEDAPRPKPKTSSRERQSRPAGTSSSPKPQNREHDYLPNGLLKTDMQGNHPLLELIAEGERKWDTMLNRQSKTLGQATAEYRRRYHRPPPRGFEEWYDFAVTRRFLLIDEFDQIDRDITPLTSFPYPILKERLEAAKRLSESTGFIITVSHADDAINVTGPAFIQERTQLLHSNILSFSRWLPDLQLYANGNDRSPRLLGAGMRQWAADRNGEFTAAELRRLEDVVHHGGDSIYSACAVPPPHDFRVDVEMAKNAAEPPTFIHDPVASSDFCLNPALAHLHGSLSTYLGARDPELFPEFVWAKTRLNGEILLPFIEAFHGFTLTNPHPWSRKTHDKLFWRGLSTGSHHQRDRGGPLGWRGGSQRLRAAFLFSNESTFSKAPWASPEVPLLTSNSSGGLQTTTFPRAALNRLYTNVGLVTPLLQCDEDGTCEEMAAELPFRPELGIWGVERGRWKYVLDLDGNGHSADFQKSLGLGSVVFKSSIFSQWNADWLVPYYHYIPIQQDFSDVYNAMAFFVGPPSDTEGDLEADGTRGHDHLAQKIGGHAERFVREQWRWEDIQVYMYRLMLEYARLVSDDRASMNFES